MDEFSTIETKLPVIVVGAGLSGTLMSIFLARRGYDVELLEKRDDPRLSEESAGRSINMAISERGLSALRQAEIEEKISDLYIPMYGRMIHDLDGTHSLQPYGQPGQCINSISRRDLNVRLLELTDAFDNIHTHFAVEVVDIDLDEKRVAIRTPERPRKHWIEGQWIIGADGINSIVRKHMLQASRMTFGQDYLDYGYKELVMPPREDGEYAMDPNALHIWPRHQYMLIALPNQDHSFTVTLFLQNAGEDEDDKANFAALQTPDAIRGFFAENFPDALERIPDLEAQFLANPIGSLVSIRCRPWHYKDAAVLIGDASHAVVPFYGQGMNAAFEDCSLLDNHLEHADALGLDVVLAHFSRSRFPHAEAIRELSLQNFVEMRSDVSNPMFVAQKQLERTLARVAPDKFIPLYSMISFTNIPYANAVRHANAQRRKMLAASALIGGAVVGAAAWLRRRRASKRR